MGASNAANVFWTERRVAELKRLWVEDRLSASLVGDALGCGKNAILGKLHRLGVKRGGKRWPSKHKIVRKVGEQGYVGRRVRLVPGAPSVVDVDRDVAVGKGECGFMELTNWTCRWPLNDCSPWRFCGGAADLAAGRSYCAEHRRLGTRG